MELEELFAIDDDSFDLDGALGDASIFDTPSAFSCEHGVTDGVQTGSIDLESVLQSSRQVAPSTNHKQQVRKQPMKNPARERLKRELQSLRECIVSLEQELSSLRTTQKRPRSTSPTTTTRNDSLVRGGGAGTSRYWERTAETERVKRRMAELENDLLRRTLESQLHVATGLTAYLRQRAASPLVPPPHIPRLRSSSFACVTAQLLHEVDYAYAMTDTMYNVHGWRTLPDERVFTSTVKTRLHGETEQMYVELMDAAYRPQDFDRVTKAAWEATRHVYVNESRVTDVGISTADVLSARYRGSGLTRRGLSKELVVTFVTKKFLERNRSVFVWRSCITPAVHDSEMPLQALSDETGWVILTRVPDGIPNRPRNTAFFQAISHLVPLWFEGDVVDSSLRTQLAIGEFTTVALSATECDAMGFEDAFQRLVLHDDDEEEITNTTTTTTGTTTSTIRTTVHGADIGAVQTNSSCAEALQQHIAFV